MCLAGACQEVYSGDSRNDDLYVQHPTTTPILPLWPLSDTAIRTLEWKCKQEETKLAALPRVGGTREKGRARSPGSGAGTHLHTDT